MLYFTLVDIVTPLRYKLKVLSRLESEMIIAASEYSRTKGESLLREANKKIFERSSRYARKIKENSRDHPSLLGMDAYGETRELENEVKKASIELIKIIEI